MTINPLAGRLLRRFLFVALVVPILIVFTAVPASLLGFGPSMFLLILYLNNAYFTPVHALRGRKCHRRG